MTTDLHAITIGEQEQTRAHLADWQSELARAENEIQSQQRAAQIAHQKIAMCQTDLARLDWLLQQLAQQKAPDPTPDAEATSDIAPLRTPSSPPTHS
jgi:chromosome segregation ATPase